MRTRSLISVGLIVATSSALAANGIDVRRGEDSLVYGSCVPSLVVENKSSETIDYLQVDLVVALSDGRQQTVELMSAYREGVLYPIAPGGTATLKAASRYIARAGCRLRRRESPQRRPHDLRSSPARRVDLR